MSIAEHAGQHDVVYTECPEVLVVGQRRDQTVSVGLERHVETADDGSVVAADTYLVVTLDGRSVHLTAAEAATLRDELGEAHARIPG